MLVAEFSGNAEHPVWKITQALREGFPGIMASDTAGVLIQSRDATAGWWTRARASSMAGPIGVRTLIEPGRVVFMGEVTLDQIQSRPPGYALEDADNSRSGEMVPGVADSVAIVPVLQPDDTLTLRFAASEQTAAEGSEDCFFVVGTTSQVQAVSSRTPRPAPGPSFALHPNRPNPFARSTTLAFALPHASHVRLEIFDMQGRRVRVLANKVFEPGEHELIWDRRTGSGAIARPGIYFYRIEAGEHRARRRMIVLP